MPILILMACHALDCVICCAKLGPAQLIYDTSQGLMLYPHDGRVYLNKFVLAAWHEA